jgi:hypothetical protein
MFLTAKVQKVWGIKKKVAEKHASFKKKILSLQRERNLFRIRAPVALASDLLK